MFAIRYLLFAVRDSPFAGGTTEVVPSIRAARASLLRHPVANGEERMANGELN
jgi:hypothetical protein